MQRMESMKPMKPIKPMEPMAFKRTERWWPEDLGEPTSSGSQDDVQYAYFRDARRLLLKDAEKMITYDTGEHAINGVSQASDAAHAKFTSDQGALNLSELRRV